MRRNLIVTAFIVFTGILLYIFVGVDLNHPGIASISTPIYSEEVNHIFISLVAGNTNLNSGITMERAATLFPEQSNNITFAVFNHTDEPIIFPNQGFDITIFEYDEIEKKWENLQLIYAPYPEVKMLPPKLEKWDFDINNTWSILENEVIAFGYEQLRIYVSGSGVKTGKVYSAYLDVNIQVPP